VALDEGDGNRFWAASTAEGAAAMRAAGAAEPDPAVRNPDSMAAAFVRGGLRFPAIVKVPGLRRLVRVVAEGALPGSYYFETARTFHIDAVVRQELRAGIEQLVLLGAGYDSRPYRLADELDGVAVFEVDHPSTAARKRERVRDVLGALPAHVTYVEVDFTADDLTERLAAHGYERDRPTLLIWSGVTPYIPEQAVLDVLRFVASHGSARTSIVFDYCFREVIEGDESFYGARELLRSVARMGEPLVFGIPRGRTAEFVEATGLSLEQDLGPEEAKRLYLQTSDGTLYGEPYGFGGFAHARVLD
jgi:methyltransferase (TIGR00027 family)